MNTDSKTYFETQFKSTFNTKSTAHGNRATGLLFCLLTLLKETRSPKASHVLIPAITCSSLVHACIAAGLKPYIYNSNSSDLGADISNVMEILNSDGNKLLAIVGVHQFGNWQDFSEIFSVANSFGIYTIEDCCQLLNPALPDSGSNFDLYSFGYSKTLNAKSGAILGTKRVDFSKYIVNVNEMYKEVSCPARIEVANKYKEDWYSFRAINETRDFSSIKRNFDKYKDFLLWGCEYPDYENLLQKFVDLQKVNVLRRENSNFLTYHFSTLKNFKIHSDVSKYSIPWRYIISVESISDARDFINLARSSNLKISSWYVTLKHGFPDYLHNNFVLSDEISLLLLNFWINEEIESKYLNDVVDLARSLNNS